MSVATIIFTDADINAGRYSVDVNVADSQTDDGLATAAHVTSMFIADVVTTPGFAEGAIAYGRAKGWSMRNDNPVKVTMTLTDENLETGMYRMDFEVEGEAEIENSITAAYMTASFIRDAMGSNEFKAAVVDFAHKLVEGRDDATVNENNIFTTAPVAVDQEAA